MSKKTQRIALTALLVTASLLAACTQEQQNKITHLEKLVEDLLARVVQAEDRANKADAVATRSFRAKLALGIDFLNPLYITPAISADKTFDRYIARREGLGGQIR